MPQVADGYGVTDSVATYHNVLLVFHVSAGGMPDTVFASHLKPAEHTARLALLVFRCLLKACTHMGEVYLQHILMPAFY